MPRRRNDPPEWMPASLIDSECGDIELGRLSQPWQYIVCNPATYPPEIFAQIAIQLIHHPELNSKNIRRADILGDSDFTMDPAEHIPDLTCTRRILRRLMPRNPNLDAELDQSCRLYAHGREEPPILVTYYSHYNNAVGLPYYAPDVLAIAFQWCNCKIYLAYRPLPGKSCTDERLQRVAINLLRTFHRHW